MDNPNWGTVSTSLKDSKLSLSIQLSNTSSSETNRTSLNFLGHVGDSDGELRYACIFSCSPELLPKKFFMQALAPGWQTLHSWIRGLIRDREIITESMVWRLMAQLLRAVSFLHDVWKQDDDPLLRVIYRNWSPSLIAIDALFHVKLIVPQNAIVNEPGTRHHSSTLDVTPKVSSFMAPEVILDDPYTTKADVYSLGTIMYLLTTLSKPRLFKYVDFATRTIEFTEEPITLLPVYSKNVYTFLSVTLCLDPFQRASVAELLTFPDIESAIGDLTGSKLAYSLLDSGTEIYDTENLEDHLKPMPSPSAYPGSAVNVRGLIESITITHPSIRIRHKKVEPSNQYIPKKPIKLMPLGESEPCYDSMGHTQLMQAVIANDVVVAGRFVHLAGYRNKAGLTALMLAASLGHSESTKLLAMSEATMRTHIRVRINQWIFQEATALMFAAGFGHSECVKQLYTREARLTETYKSRTSLMAACYFGHYPCAKVLAPYEARMRDVYGKTALMYAAECNSVKCVQCLVNKEAGIIMKKRDGIQSEWTALVFAVYEGNFECVKVLAPIEAPISGEVAINLINRKIFNARNRKAPEHWDHMLSIIEQHMNDKLITDNSE